MAVQAAWGVGEKQKSASRALIVEWGIVSRFRAKLGDVWART